MGVELAIGGAFLGTTGSVVSGISASNASNYNADVAALEGRYAKRKARVDEAAYRKGLKRTIGKAQSVAGASGFSAGEGTNVDLIDQIRKEGEIDAALIRHGGEVGSWKSESESQLYKSQAHGQKTAGYLNAGATMLGATSKIGYNKYSGYSTSWFGK